MSPNIYQAPIHNIIIIYVCYPSQILGIATICLGLYGDDIDEHATVLSRMPKSGQSIAEAHQVR